MTIDWSVNINSILLTIVAGFQLMFFLGKYVMGTESSTVITRADILRVETDVLKLEKELANAKKEFAQSLSSMQQNMTMQHTTLANTFVTAAEFRMFVRGRELFETNVISRLDVLTSLKIGNHES